MFHTLLKFQEKLATLPVLTVLICGYFLFPLLLLPQILPAPYKPLDLMPFYTPEIAYTILNSYDLAAKVSYINGSQSIDTLYPVYYATLFGLILSFYLVRLYSDKHPAQVIRLLPYAAMAFDLIENFAIISMLQNLPEQNMSLAWLAASMTLLKWVVIVTCILCCAGFAIKFYRVQDTETSTRPHNGAKPKTPLTILKPGQRDIPKLSFAGHRHPISNTSCSSH
ncbi:hypothetical protein OLMES_0166 [Oleiphilus messinensis]|uniref:Uncharacterized protein n=1 Tax=Oleiphilus messinensis TaxID=141451 RepID=A0A1Y0I493_9GAMM|nr:hypothetical protein [Oleiphilus messinensis]ARU54274.1 hypothetical protein OLMES_0166 [Oleiphilus messinensis]